MKFLITLLIFIFSFSLFAQEMRAKIYFNDGTVREGLASMKKNRISFRSDKNSKKKKYNQDEVNKIRIIGGKNGGTYYYKKILGRNKVILVQAFNVGKVNLYKVYRKFYSPSMEGSFHKGFTKTIKKYYINKDLEDLIIRDLGDGNIISKDFKEIAPNYFADCPSVMKKINNNFFGKKGIKRLVNMYNTECN